MPGKGLCAKNMAVIIAMSDILQLQDDHRIRFYKFPKIKNCAKKQVVNLRNASAAHHLKNAVLFNSYVSGRRISQGGPDYITSRAAGCRSLG